MMKTFRAWLNTLALIAIAAGLWWMILHPRPVVQSFVYDMQDSTIHIWGDEKQNPIRIQIPKLTK